MSADPASWLWIIALLVVVIALLGTAIWQDNALYLFNEVL